MQNTLPESIKKPSPAEWYAMLEKCKTAKEVDELRMKHADAIEKNDDLRRLFVAYKIYLKNSH
jgi:hypothetical protein